MHESTAHGQSPFMITQQYEPWIDIEPMTATTVLAAEDLVSKVCKKLMKKQVWLAPDLVLHKYKIGNKVWLLTDHLIMPGAKKFKEKYIGQYMVLDTPL